MCLLHLKTQSLQTSAASCWLPLSGHIFKLTSQNGLRVWVELTSTLSHHVSFTEKSMVITLLCWFEIQSRLWLEHVLSIEFRLLVCKGSPSAEDIIVRGWSLWLSWKLCKIFDFMIESKWMVDKKGSIPGKRQGMFWGSSYAWCWPTCPTDIQCSWLLFQQLFSVSWCFSGY